METNWTVPPPLKHSQLPWSWPGALFWWTAGRRSLAFHFEFVYHILVNTRAWNWLGNGYFNYIYILLYYLVIMTVNYSQFLKMYFFIFREGGRERERETSVWEGNIDHWLLHMPWPGSEPATQASVLTRKRTGDLSLCRMMPNRLSHTCRSSINYFLIQKIKIFLNKTKPEKVKF